MKHKRIILVGPSAAGKTYMRDSFVKQGFKGDISYTSRPPRDTETDGIDYHFIPASRFKKMIKNGEFYEFVGFGDYYYGTANISWSNSDIFVMETEGVKSINSIDRPNCIIIYVNTPLDIRINRMLKRGWPVDKVLKRLETDNENFKNFTDFDIEICSMQNLNLVN